MTDAILKAATLKYAPRMLPLAAFLTKVAMALKYKGLRLDEKARKIAGSRYRMNHVVHFMEMSDLENIVKMGRLISYDAETIIHGTSDISIESDDDDDDCGRGRMKMTAYSADKLKQQAILLNKIRRSHARGAVALIRSVGAIVKRMKRIDAKVKRTMTKNLLAAGHHTDGIEDVLFEPVDYRFAWALKKVNEVLDEVQAVADTPLKNEDEVPNDAQAVADVPQLP
jgi:hypothetical protein